MLKKINPHIILFIETKLSSSCMEEVRHKCGFLFGLEVAAEGTREGLCIGLKEHISISLRNLSKNHIDVEISEEVDDVPWRFIGFYS